MFPINSTNVSYVNHFLTILGDEVQNSSIVDCVAVAKYCSWDSKQGVRARQMCPQQCGCDDPNSGLALTGTNGCPPSCTKTDKHRASISSRSCEDYNVSSDYWARFGGGLAGLKASYPKAWKGDFNKTIALLKGEGCGVISKNMSLTLAFFGWDPCQKSILFVQSLTYACPSACQCGAQPRLLCPEKCRA